MISRLYFCNGQTGIFDLVESAWQAISMHRNGVLAESFIFLTLTELRQINTLEWAYGKANVLSGDRCHACERCSLFRRVSSVDDL